MPPNLAEDPSVRPAANRDIVLWDQRGTLYSKPALMCPEVSKQELESAQRHESDAGAMAASVAAYRACGARLATEAGDLSAFNSAENADDIEDLRVALGYDAINFYGVSYGTELGQFLMRQHPQHLQSVILDAVVPLNYNIFTEPAFAQQRIGEKYLRGCAAEPTCNAAFPDLARRYLALVDRLNATPVTLQVTPLADSSTRYPVVLTGDLLEGALYSSLYMKVHDLIPLIVDHADKGDYTFVSTILLPLSLFDSSMATGMHQTVSCADRGDTDPDAAEFPGVLPRLAKSTREGARQELGICRDWNIELLPRAALDPVTSDIPTLLLSGDFDPITPPQYAASLLPHLPNATHVIFPLGSHGQAVTGTCGNRIIQKFLDDPHATVDSSCVRVSVPAFATDKDVIFLKAVRHLMARGGFTGLLYLGLFAVPAVLCAALQRGELQAGSVTMTEALATYRATGVRLFLPFCLALLAEGYLQAGSIREGLQIVTEALQLTETNLDSFWEAELYRLKGELTLAQSSVQSLASSVKRSPKSKVQRLK